MTLDEFRLEMASYWRSADDEARTFKDPHVALKRLRALYGKFDDIERQMADQVIGEWALSEDERLRFDALALVENCKIDAAIPALQKLTTHLASNSASSAPDELEKIQRIIAGLV